MKKYVPVFIFFGLALGCLIGLLVVININFDSSETRMAVILMLALFAIVFVICGLAMISGVKKTAKRMEALNAAMAKVDGKLLTGYISAKGEAGKAAAKTAGSICGAICSATCIGVGTYKIYSGKAEKQFVITPTSLFILDTANPNIFLDESNRITHDDFAPVSIEKESNGVLMTDAGGRIMRLNVAKSGYTPDELAATLEKVLSEASAASAAKIVDPFENTEPAQAAQTDATQAAPAQPTAPAESAPADSSAPSDK